MEKRTIGSFIAVLRKANGLTQKQLAEKLMVTDKTVSRWERDETLPDLTLIPVIAEIFGVTSDELLRGERREPDKMTASADRCRERQIQRILTGTKTTYRIHRVIAIVVAVIGLIIMAGCAESFSSGSGIDGHALGIMLGIVFNLTGVVYLIIRTVGAYQSIDNEEFDGEQIKQLKRFLANKTLSACRGILVAFVLVLVGIVSGGDGEEWFFLSLIWGAAVLCFCYIVEVIVRQRLENENGGMET